MVFDGNPVSGQDDFGQMRQESADREIHLEERVYAGFFVRLAAYLIDWLIVGAALLVIKIPMWIISFAGGDFLMRDFIFRYSAYDILIYLLKVVYFVLLTYYTGATLGKKLMNIAVVSEEDRKPTLFEIVYRESVGKFLSGLIMSVGYIIIGLDRKKRGLHDHLADTCVVYRHKRTVYVAAPVTVQRKPFISTQGPYYSQTQKSQTQGSHQAQESRMQRLYHVQAQDSRIQNPDVWQVQDLQSEQKNSEIWDEDGRVFQEQEQMVHSEYQNFETDGVPALHDLERDATSILSFEENSDTGSVTPFEGKSNTESDAQFDERPDTETGIAESSDSEGQ